MSASIHDTAAVEEVRQRWRLEPNLIRRLSVAFYKKQLSAAESLGDLTEGLRETVLGAIRFHSLQLQARHDSGLDGASKLLFRSGGGRPIEAVILRIASGRTSLCISSQAGCAAGCAFCATGHMGFAANLTRDEILDQVIQANQLLRLEGRKIRNVVFMGMGEPFHNEAAVHQAVELLIAPDGFDISPARVLVSTVGIPGAMVRCAERFPQVGMALSLHSACQKTRQRLMPLARRYSLDDLRASLTTVNRRQRRPVMVEYLLVEDVNDTDAEIAALIAYLAGLNAHINLIPYNPIAEAPDLAGTPPQRRRAIATVLVRAGFKVTIRHSLGSDIAAACGQLARNETAAMSPAPAASLVSLS